MVDAWETVFLVDDDVSVRKGLGRLLRSRGLHVHTYESAEAFLEQSPQAHPACLVLDIRMPGIDGLELQNRLTATDDSPPIIFLTGNGDIPLSVRAMKTGAVDFLEKPVDDQDLLTAIDQALAQDRHYHGARDDVQALRARLHTLTPREFDVFQHVIGGSLNKQIAYQLAISEKTVKVHRGRVMDKLGVESVAELVWLAARLGLHPCD